MPNFQTSPMVLEAFQWTGQDRALFPEWAKADLTPMVTQKKMLLHTQHGYMMVNLNDWVMRGPDKNLWPVTNAIFGLLYKPV